MKVRKAAKIRNHTLRRIPHEKETKTKLNITNKSQEISPFSAGDHKAARNRRESTITRDINNTNDPQKKYHIGMVSKILYWRA